jgi:hypothetical protein
MQVSFQLTPNDYRDGVIAWRNVRAWRRWVVVMVYVAGSIAIIVSLIRIFSELNASTLATLGAVLGLMAFWLAIMWAAPRLTSQRQFRNTPSAHSPMTIEATDAGLHVRSAQADSKVAWSVYMAWGEYKSVFVILPQPRIYVPIPKRAFTAEQQSEFRELLRRNIKPQPK